MPKHRPPGIFDEAESAEAEAWALAYQASRTGLTFGDVRRLLAIEQAQIRARGEYMYVTRATVLGRWRELKLGMFGQDLD